MAIEAYTEIFNKYFSSDKNLLKNIIKSISLNIDKTGNITNLSHKNILLAIDEAVTNAMEHGNKWKPEKKIHIEIKSDRSKLHATITDEGKGFDTKFVSCKSNLIYPLRRRGRGIQIMQQFSKIKWNNKGNQIKLEFNLTANK